MKNRIISVVMGIFSAWIIVALGDLLNHQLFPAPKGIDHSNKEELKNFIDQLPLAAFISMLVVFALSAFTGGFVTAKIAKTNWQRLCLIAGLILLIANVGNMFVIPQPSWFNLVAVLLYLPLSYLGGSIGKRSAKKE